MAKKAILSVCGQDFRLLEFNLNLGQKVDVQGRPASKVFLGDFYMIIRGGDDLFFDWMGDPTRMESGMIKVFYKNQDSPFLEYSFVQGFVTSIMESLYDNDQMQNSFNLVSTQEDESEEFEMWTNISSWKEASKQNSMTHVLANSVAKTRQFQQRTGITHLLMVTLSCEKVTIRDIEHDNQWAGR